MNHATPNIYLCYSQNFSRKIKAFQREIMKMYTLKTCMNIIHMLDKYLKYFVLYVSVKILIMLSKHSYNKLLYNTMRTKLLNVI